MLTFKSIKIITRGIQYNHTQHSDTAALTHHAFVTASMQSKRKIADISNEKRFNYLTLVVDSGCSQHLSNLDTSYFTNVKSQQTIFTTANGSPLISMYVGDLPHLPNVCISNTAYNLASVPQLCDSNNIVVFDKTTCKLFSADSIAYLGNPLFVANRQNNSYLLKIPLNYSVDIAETSLLNMHAFTVDAQHKNRCTVWHCRLNHLNIASMRKLKLNGSIPDMIWTAEEESAFRAQICEGCIKGKFKAKPTFKKIKNPSNRIIDRPGKLIFIDLYFSNIPSAAGFTVGIIIVDAFSRCAWTRHAKTKDDAAAELKSWIDEMIREKIDVKNFCLIKSDAGGEFTANNFKSLLTSIGMRQEIAPPKSHVAVAERHIGLLKENLRSSIQAAYANLSKAAEWVTKGKTSNPFIFWPEAARHACAVSNFLPSQNMSVDFTADTNPTPSQQKNKNQKINTDPVSPPGNTVFKNQAVTKFQLFYSRPPDISRLKIFGCLTYVLNHVTLRQTMDSTASEGIHMGFDMAVPHTWRVLKFNTCRIVNSKDCVFNENLEFQKVSVFDKSLHESFQYWNEDPDALGEYAGDAIHPDIHNVPWISPIDNIVNPFAATFQHDEPHIPQHMAFSLLLTPMERLDRRIPKNVHEALSSENWTASLAKETNSLSRNEVIKIVKKMPHFKVFDITYVFKIKKSIITGILTYKTRICFRGDRQVHYIDYDETYAPVVRLKSLRTILALSAATRSHIHHMDVDTAFLYGVMDDNEPDIYVKIPQGYPVPPEFQAAMRRGEQVCGKLEKALYGLKQAPRLWNKNINTFLVTNGFQPTISDPCVYTRDTSTGRSYIALFVDDLVISAPTMPEMDEIKLLLSSRYNMKDLGIISECLGMRIIYDQITGSLNLDQTEYIEQMLQKFNLQNLRPANTPLDPGVKLSRNMAPVTEDDKIQALKFPYQEIIGSVMYLMLCTRPDIAFAVSQLSKYNTCHGTAHHTSVIHLMRYLSATSNLRLTYGQQSTFPMGFSDSDYAFDVDSRKSVTGYVFYVAGGPVSWKSQSQATVALSSAEAEYMALAAATQEAVHLRQLMIDIDPVYAARLPPVHIFEDNTGAIAISNNPVHHERTKHIDVRYHFIRERIAMNHISVHYISTDKMIADLLTKPISVQISKTLLLPLLGCLHISEHVSKHVKLPDYIT